MAYQSFDNQKGDSDSESKLARLFFPSSFSGKSFLDIGCNEGFFCHEAIKRGATEAVGIDSDSAVLERATARAVGKKIRYINTSWWDIPDRQFDIILMSSALHYEPNPRALANEICKRLRPKGLFILEAGIYCLSDERIFVDVQRHDGSLLFPTRNTLIEDVLSAFAVRYVGPSIFQSGDPLERHVFHCQKKRPVALVFWGESGSGKSYVSSALALKANVPRFDHDHLLGIIARNEFSSHDRIVKEISSSFDVSKIYKLVDDFVKQGRSAELANLFAKHVNGEADLVMVDGYSFIYPEIREPFAAALRLRGFDVWFAGKMQ